MVSIVQSFWSTSRFLLFSFKTATPETQSKLNCIRKMTTEAVDQIVLRKLIIVCSYFVSDCVSNSVCAVIGVLECPAVGSSAFSSPFVELTTCGCQKRKEIFSQVAHSETNSLFAYLYLIYCILLNFHKLSLINAYIRRPNDNQ